MDHVTLAKNQMRAEKNGVALSAHAGKAGRPLSTGVRETASTPKRTITGSGNSENRMRMDM